MAGGHKLASVLPPAYIHGMSIRALPLSVREIRATEKNLDALYAAAYMGLSGDSMALAAGLLPAEYRTLASMDPLVELAEAKARADAERALAGVVQDAALGGDVALKKPFVINDSWEYGVNAKSFGSLAKLKGWTDDELAILKDAASHKGATDFQQTISDEYGGIGAQRVTQVLQKNGYDGVKVNRNDDLKMRKNVEIIVFDPAHPRILARDGQPTGLQSYADEARATLERQSPESQAIARYREVKGPKSVVRMEAALRTAGVPLPKNEPVAYIQKLVDRAHMRN